MPRVTIKDVAKASGLSVCTINKALNGKPWVSAETRQRVIALAAELGYQPNRLAQALARRTLQLAVVYPEFWSQWFAPLVAGVRQGVLSLQDHNIASQFHQLAGGPSSHNLIDVLRTLQQSAVDGVILCAGGYDLDTTKRTAQFLDALSVPLVLLGGVFPQIPHLTSVRADTRRSGRMAAEMLHMLIGHRSAAVLIGQHAIVDHSEKAQGFADEAQRLELPVVGTYETFDDPDMTAQVMDALFTQHPDVGGIYIAIDNPAEGVSNYLLKHQRAGQVKIVATGTFPHIREMLAQDIIQATFYQNMREQGRLAVRTLFRYLSENAAPPHELLVPPSIAIRGNIEVFEGDEQR
jgi:LacI family transcriptional regulator